MPTCTKCGATGPSAFYRADTRDAAARLFVRTRYGEFEVAPKCCSDARSCLAGARERAGRAKQTAGGRG